MDARPVATPVRTAAPHPALAAHVWSYVSTEDPNRDVSLAALPAPVLFTTWGGAVQIVTASSRTLPAAVQRWAEAIAEAPGFEARVALADAFLRARLPGYDVQSGRAVGLVAQEPGSASVLAVAETLGVSERTLRRRFTDDLGIGVKMFAQIERYRQAHGLLLRTPGASWRDVCERFGYADQSHFVRSFRRFAGAPPTRWRPDEHRFDLGFGLREEGA